MTMPQAPAKQYRQGPAGWTALVVLLALLGALGLSWLMPLGVSEAGALEKLRDAAQPQLGWQGPFWHQMQGLGQSGQAAMILWLGTLLAHLWPDLSTLWALRLPDILALAPIMAVMMRRSSSLLSGLWPVLLGLVWPLVWLLWLGPPGLAVNAAAAAVLVQAGSCPQQRPGWPALLIMSLAALVLIANGVAVFMVALLGGSYLYTGVSQKRWRLFGNSRLSLLAALLVAGLTLVDVLSWPDLARWLAVFAHARQLLAQQGLSTYRIVFALAIGAVPTIMALAGAIMTAYPPGRRLLLILLVSALVFMSAPGVPVSSLALLLPVVMMWWATPLTEAHPRIAPIAAATYGLWTLVLAGALLYMDLGQLPYMGQIEYMALGGWLLMAVLTVWLLWHWYRRRLRVPAGLALPGLLSLACVLGYALVSPQTVWPQRSYHQYLVQAAPAWQAQPMAALAPVNADFWRTALQRPLLALPDGKALRQWGKQRQASSKIVLVRPAAAKAILAEFDNSRPVAQAPGTAQTSVMAIELKAVDEDAKGL